MSHASTTILGYLGRDPETRSAGETTCTTLAIAVGRRVKSAAGTEDRTTWWRAQVWGAGGLAAEEHLKKGDPVIATGWPELREYQDKDNQPRTSLDLVHASWSFAAGKRTRPEAPIDRPAPRAPLGTLPAAGGDDEPPF